MGHRPSCVPVVSMNFFRIFRAKVSSHPSWDGPPNRRDEVRVEARRVMKRKAPATPTYRAGDAVLVFFRWNAAENRDNFPVVDLQGSSAQVAFTDCWVHAFILEDWEASNCASAGRVHVCYAHPFWSNRHGEALPSVGRAAICKAAAAAGAASAHTCEMAAEASCDAYFSPTDVRQDVRGGVVPAAPSLSVIVVRWNGELSLFDDTQWGGLSSSVSDTYIGSFCDALHACIGPDYEVLSVFVQSGEDLRRLQPSALAARLSGRHRCALYFLWPTTFRDGTALQQMGMVPAPPYFAAMQGLEAAGVPTRFPHASQLYRTLLAKDWQAALCLSPQYRLPPTTMVNRALVTVDAERAAAQTMQTLRLLRGVGEPPPLLGVVKLGH
eukprot:2438935-Prymnesium_polylepis.1